MGWQHSKVSHISLFLTRFHVWFRGGANDGRAASHVGRPGEAGHPLPRLSPPFQVTFQLQTTNWWQESKLNIREELVEQPDATLVSKTGLSLLI